jgi:hypothetical protein
MPGSSAKANGSAKPKPSTTKSKGVAVKAYSNGHRRGKLLIKISLLVWLTRVVSAKEDHNHKDSSSEGEEDEEETDEEGPQFFLSLCSSLIFICFVDAKRTYRSWDGKYIYIKEDGDYVRYKFLERPQEKWIELEKALELDDSLHNHRLFLNMQVSNLSFFLKLLY